MLNQIFTWWLRQMIGLVPARLQRVVSAPDALIVAVDRLESDAAMAGPPGGTIFIRRGGIETLAAKLPQPVAAAAGRLQTVLRLPEHAVLTREVTLPLAAARDLYNVLGFEMDRLTPFQPEEIFWGVTGLTRDPARQLRMNLLITLRAPVENLLASLARLNLKPEFLEGYGLVRGLPGADGGLRADPAGAPASRDRGSARANHAITPDGAGGDGLAEPACNRRIRQ
jgi:general secretion pathway protein L